MATVNFKFNSKWFRQEVEIIGECMKPIGRSPNSNGYFMVCYNGKQTSMHRAIYSHLYGAIPDGKIIRHKCDNPNCINPEHLNIGTQQDNVRDRVVRGRSAISENNGRSKLKKYEVEFIYKDNQHTKMETARYFNVDPAVIRDIKNRKTWRNVTED